MAIVLDLVVLARVDPGLQVAFFSIVFEGLVEVADWQAVVHDIACVLHRHREELLQVFVIWLILQVLLLPGIGALAVPHQHVEIGIQQQNHLFFQLVEVELNRHGLLLVGGVAEQCGLDHDHAVGDRLAHHAGLDVDGLVGRRAEGVDECAATQVVNELWEVLHWVGQPEGVFIVAVEVREAD